MGTLIKIQEKLKNEAKQLSEKQSLLKERTLEKALKIKNKIKNEVEQSEIVATRKNYQIGRRLTHLSMGFLTAAIYALFLKKETAVSIFGIIATLTYLFEHIRVRYPEHASKFKVITKYFLRAEEQLKESAALPYVMAILLTMITFPKLNALGGILTLAFADPLSALIGIRFGTTRNKHGKSKEGSLAFFVVSFLVSFLLFYPFNDADLPFFLFTFITSLLVTFF